MLCNQSWCSHWCHGVNVADVWTLNMNNNGREDNCHLSRLFVDTQSWRSCHGGKWAIKSNYLLTVENTSQHSTCSFRSELHSGNTHFKSWVPHVCGHFYLRYSHEYTWVKMKKACDQTHVCNAKQIPSKHLVWTQCKRENSAPSTERHEGQCTVKVPQITIILTVSLQWVKGKWDGKRWTSRRVLTDINESSN